MQIGRRASTGIIMVVIIIVVKIELSGDF